MTAIQIFRKPKKSEVAKAKIAFAKAIYNKRVYFGISQQLLGEIAGVDRKTINRIENGHFFPNLDTIIRLSTVLKIQPNKFLKI